jgi:hypothetical protein
LTRERWNGDYMEHAIDSIFSEIQDNLRPAGSASPASKGAAPTPSGSATGFVSGI